MIIQQLYVRLLSKEQKTAPTVVVGVLQTEQYQ